MIALIPVTGIPAVQPGDDLAALLREALAADGIALEDGDVIVVASKIVSKAEGAVVSLATLEPSPRALELAEVTGKDPRIAELVLRESTEVVRTAPNVLIVRHRLGFTSANAAIDQSNVGLGDDAVLVLPDDPDASATRLRTALAAIADVGVVIADTHGRAFRRGNVGVAVGIAGVPSLEDRRGEHDLFGRVLEATFVPTADLLAGAAGLVTGEGDEGLPVVIVRGAGLRTMPTDTRAGDLLRDPAEDLFAGPRAPS